MGSRASLSIAIRRPFLNSVHFWSPCWNSVQKETATHPPPQDSADEVRNCEVAQHVSTGKVRRQRRKRTKILKARAAKGKIPINDEKDDDTVAGSSSATKDSAAAMLAIPEHLMRILRNEEEERTRNTKE